MHVEKENFMNYYKFDSNQDRKYVLTAIFYWSFTTLTTVGFGDYSPRSESEKLITVIIFVLGVSIFSHVMGNFIEMLHNITLLNKEYEEDESLSMFLSMLDWFNDEPINERFKKEIHDFFDYKWEKDPNICITEK